MKKLMLVTTLVLFTASLSFGEYGSIICDFGDGSVRIDGTWHDIEIQLAPFTMLSVEKITLHASSLSYGEWLIATPSYQWAMWDHYNDEFYPMFAVYSSYDNLYSGITSYDISPRQISLGIWDSQWNGPFGFSNSKPLSVGILNPSSNASLAYIGNGYDIGLDGFDDVDFWSISRFSYSGPHPIVEFSYIPEPATLLLLALGGLALRGKQRT